MYIDYKKLEIWQMAYDFVLQIYGTVEKFPKYEENNITSQLRRAATCLPLNIAEGSGARSHKIFLNYLIFAYRSVRETETLLMLSKELKYFDEAEYSRLWCALDLFTRKLVAYMNYLEKDVIKYDRKKDLSHFYRHHKSAIDRRESIGKLA
ncbi:MAG TPA: four helix bundle protein [Candidatus Nanoarchaeia archaeon]|nr:four helix bundle protein [Candidatus Nanoarchaeia archaeon]